MRIEIKNTEKEVIDWNKPQLVISKNQKILIRTNGINNSECFEGMNLENGIFSPSWFKTEFKPFNGTVTLSND